MVDPESDEDVYDDKLLSGSDEDEDEDDGGRLGGGKFGGK